jgi:hypothetical protein
MIHLRVVVEKVAQCMKSVVGVSTNDVFLLALEENGNVRKFTENKTHHNVMCDSSEASKVYQCSNRVDSIAQSI